MGAVAGLDTFSGRQADGGVVANALQDVGQEEVLGVEGNVQQEPGGASSDQHPEVPAGITDQGPCFTWASGRANAEQFAKSEPAMHPTSCTSKGASIRLQRVHQAGQKG